MKNTYISTVAAIVVASFAMFSQASAADLTASSTVPKVNFYDTDVSDILLYFFANDQSGGTWFNLYDDRTTNWLISGLSNGNQNKSIEWSSVGDIGLADGSVFIDKSANRMGIGTTTPAYTLDAVGNIRFGVSSYPWYTSTGSYGLYFGNATGSTSYGLGIANSAPTYTLMVGTNTAGKEGNVGIGTGAPQAKLDVRGDIASSFIGANTERDGTKYLVSLSANNSDTSKTSDAGFALENTREGFKWEFRTFEFGQGFTATKALTGGGEFRIENPTNDFHNAKMVVGNVTVFENGHLVTASSRSLKTDIKPLDTQKALDAFRQLQPVSFAYKAHKDEPVVGFIAEDIPELVAMPSRKSFDSAEVVAVLTKVLQEQDKSLAEAKVQLKTQAEKIAKLEKMQKRLAKVESLLTNLALDTSGSKTEKVSLNSK